MKYTVLMFVSAAAISTLYGQHEAVAGAYLNSAHGNTTYGVNRTSTSSLGYVRANCAHCHEQHASIGGSEPDPVGGAPSGNLLFYNNYVNQSDGFCFKCHTNTGAVQTGGGVVNRSYSYRAGGWTDDTVNNVRDAFSLPSSHNLADIRTFISTRGWGYSTGSNPCSACHDPHTAQGDPANSGNSPKTTIGTRGWMLSRPSQHGSPPWALWGDDVGEKLFASTSAYQAPYRYGGIGNGYEPDGGMTTDGSNLTDFNTFCTDCHNSSNVINSTLLGPLKTINWAASDRHGLPTGSPSSATLIAPYTSNTTYVLACTDCHESHGSTNIYLVRQEVNNGLVTVTGAAQVSAGTQWASLCERCHDNSAQSLSHHTLPGADVCVDCHAGGTGYTSCVTCHYHGSTVTFGGTTYRTF